MIYRDNQLQCMPPRCHICSGRFERSGFVTCPDCEQSFHEQCLEYHNTFECDEAADEPAVGAVEL